MLSYPTVLYPPHDAPGSTSNTAVSPAAGGPGTKFTYTVAYENKTAPTVHDVIVDGKSITMAATKTLKNNRTEYQASTTLAPGPHTYSFEFGAGSKSWRMPYNNVSYSGPTVAPFGLSGITANSPGNPTSIGQLGQSFTIHVKYTSPAGKMPTRADVVIDGQPHQMTDVTGTPTTGITYEYTDSSLSQGDHYFQFKFNDGSGVQNYQEYIFSISPIILQDSKVSPTSGTTSTQFAFSTVYYGPDMPAQMDVVVEWSDLLGFHDPVGWQP
jgi:hypothetical protein